MPDSVFAVLINEKQLGFLYVTDIGDDGWVEVLYNKKTGENKKLLNEDSERVITFSIWGNTIVSR